MHHLCKGAEDGRLTWGLGFVGHNTTDEVRVSGVQGSHEVVELILFNKEEMVVMAVPLLFYSVD